MVKKSEAKSEAKEIPETSSGYVGVKSAVKKTIWVIVIAGAVWGMWKNPQLVSRAKEMISTWSSQSAAQQEMSTEQDEIAVLRQEVLTLQDNLGMLQNSLSGQSNEQLNQRFADLEKNNLNIIDSKADASVVLGMVNRLDKLEDQVEKLSRTTDESALILTAVMLVKDSADQGRKFEYEAEILQQLAVKNIKIKTQLDVIAKYAASGVKTEAYLINDFGSVYISLVKKQKEEFEKTWKDRVNSKLNEIIKVRRTDDKAPQFEENKALDQVRKLVEVADFVPAVAILRDPANAELLSDPELQGWLSLVQARLDFNTAINQIANNALAVMKVKSIREATDD